MGMFGITIPASSVADALKGNKEWSSMYGSIGEGYGDINTMESKAINSALLNLGNTESMLQNNLSQNLLAAYEEAFQQKNLVQASNLGQGYKQHEVSDIDDALNSAYQSYINQFRSEEEAARIATADSVADITQQAQASRKTLDDAKMKLDTTVEGEGQNYTDFYETIPEYIRWLYSQEDKDDTGALTEIFNKSDWSDYRNDEGQFIGTEILKERMYNIDPETNDITLTDEGKRIYAQALYEMSGRGLDAYSYQSFVSENYKDLAQWLSSPVAYEDWTPLVEGREKNNLGYAVDLLGLTDINYRWDISSLEDVNTARDYKNLVNDNLETTGGHKVNIDDEGNMNHYNTDVGDVQLYNTDNNTIMAFNSLEIKGKARDAGNDNFKMTYNGETYRFETVPNRVEGSRLVEGDEIYDTIKKTTGILRENTIYSYGNNFYVAINTKDGLILRQLQAQGTGGKTWKSTSYNDFTSIVGDIPNSGTNINFNKDVLPLISTHYKGGNQ